MSDEKIWYEWGYQLADGECVWQDNYGTDGSWTEPRPDLGVGNIDIYPGSEYRTVRSELDRSGLVDAAVVRRQVREIRSGPEMVSE